MTKTIMRSAGLTQASLSLVLAFLCNNQSPVGRFLGGSGILNLVIRIKLEMLSGLTILVLSGLTTGMLSGLTMGIF